MAWIEVHQSLPTHRKTLALADALDIEPVQAVGHLTCLWLWAMDNAPDGALLDIPARTIARAAQWTGDPAAFELALLEAGFIEVDHAIHDWPDYAGRLIERREANRERMRAARASRAGTPQPPTDGTRAAHVQDTNSARAGATVPNPTVPNLTGDEDPPSPAGDAPRAKGKPLPKPSARETVVDEAFEDELVSEFEAAFGTREAARDCIAAAMGHKARSKYTDQRAYLRNWVRSDAEKAQQRRGPPVASAPTPLHKPRAIGPAVPADSPFLRYVK